MISEAATPLRTVIADNDPLVRRLAATVLGELGFETRVAADGADAWRMIEEARPHLVVIDAETPIVDGVEVCRRIRELDSGGEVFVMFLAGRDWPAALQSLLDA